MGGLGGLADYGDSEGDQDEVDEKPSLGVSEGPEGSRDLSEEAIKAARRQRAKEWTRKRRTLASDQT
jgi:hypothetical protein